MGIPILDTRTLAIVFKLHKTFENFVGYRKVLARSLSYRQDTIQDTFRQD